MMAGALAKAIDVLYDGVDRGRSNGSKCPDATRGTTGGDDDGARAHCVAEGLKRGSDYEGPGDRNSATMQRPPPNDGLGPEGRGLAEATKGGGRA